MTWIRELFIQPREQLCSGLRSMGIDAELMRRNAPEEHVMKKGIQWRSLGAIAISSGPIRWANIRRFDPFEEALSSHWAHYGVPDARLVDRDFREFHIYSHRTRTLPMGRGRVVEVRWQGEDLGTGILNTLNSQGYINDVLVDSNDIQIQAHPASGCWSLTVKFRTTSHSTIIDFLVDHMYGGSGRVVPRFTEWQSYQAIAQCLLEADLRPVQH